MTFKTELQELFAHAATTAAEMFKDTGEVLPMWHVVDANDENLLISTPWQDGDEKRLIVGQLRRMFHEKHVKRFVFMCEAWTARGTGEQTMKAMEYIGRMEEYPDRREVLMINAEDKNGEEIAGMFYILRPEHGKPTLSELHMDKSTHSAGLMRGLLR
jgi:hypothetical protein